MKTVTVVVPRDPQSCWRLFTDISLLGAWVPGLRRAQVLATERGLPSEIHFEFAESRVYTLTYRYDADAREIRWRPKLGALDGVTGSVRFDPFDAGTRVTYTLEHGDNRSADERALGDVEKLVEAFVAWMRNA